MTQILSSQGQRRSQMPCADLLGHPHLSSVLLLCWMPLTFEASLAATEVSPLYQVSNLRMTGLLVSQATWIFFFALIHSDQ